MHALTTYFIYSSNNLTLESIVSHKYIDVEKTTKVGSSRVPAQISKCISANNSPNTQVILLLNTHKNTQFGSLLQYIKNIYKQNQREVCPSLRKFAFLIVKRRILHTSLNFLFKINCKSYTEWSCNRK